MRVWTEQGEGRKEVGRIASLGSLTLLQLPGVDERAREELRSVEGLQVGLRTRCLAKQIKKIKKKSEID